GHLHDAGLEHLDLVAAERLQHEVHAVRQPAHVDLALPDAHGLDEHEVEEVVQKPADLEGVGAEAAELALARLAAEVELRAIDGEAHAHAIAEQRAARGQARRIDGDHRDRQIARSRERERHAADQRRLAAAGRAGDADEGGVAALRMGAEELEDPTAPRGRVGPRVLEDADEIGDRQRVKRERPLDGCGDRPVAGVGRAHRWSTRSSMSPTMSAITSTSPKSAGVKMRRTPRFFSASKSSDGMMPPITSWMRSAAPALASPSRIWPASSTCEPDRIDAPMTSAPSATADCTISSGVSRMPE